MSKLNELLSEFPEEIKKLLEEERLSSNASDGMVNPENEEDSKNLSLSIPALMGAVKASKISPAAERAMDGIKNTAQAAAISESSNLDKLKHLRDILKSGGSFLAKEGEDLLNGDALQLLKQGYEKTVKPTASYIEKMAESPIGKGIGKIASSKVGKGLGYAGLGYEGTRALNELKQGRPWQATAHGLQAAGLGLGMVPHPYAKVAGLGLGAAGLGMEYGASDEPKNPEEPVSSKRLNELEQNGKIADIIQDNLSNDYEGAESLNPYSSPTPSPTPTPTPSPSPEKSAGIKNTLMDIIGMPSAYAEEMPKSEAPAPSAELEEKVEQPEKAKKKKDREYYKNFIAATSMKTGLHPALLLSVVPVESSWKMDSTLENPKPGRLGQGNALGPMQIMPGTVADFVNRAEKQKYENPEIQKLVSDQINNLKSKINFAPYQRAYDAVYSLKRKHQEPSPQQVQNLSELTQDLSARLKELSPEEQIRLSAGILKLKSLDYKLDPLDPTKVTSSLLPGTKKNETHFQKLIRSYTGLAPGTESYEYLDKVNPILQQNLGQMEEYQKDENLALPFSEQSKSGATPEIGTPVSIDQIDNTPDEDSDDEEEIVYPNDVKDLLRQSKEEDSQKRIRDLMILRNYLQSGTQAQMLKGLQLAASGIVGAGPKKSFITVPETKGAETFDALAKEGEKGITFNELMSKYAERSPSSLASKRMQNYYVSAMKRLHPDKPVDIDVIKSMSKEELEKELEREKEFSKYENTLYGKTLDRKFKVQKQAQARSKAVLEPIIQRLQGAKTLDDTIAKIDSGELIDSKQIASQVSNELGALLLPPGVKLGVTAQEKLEIDSAISRIKRLQNFFDTDVIRGIIPKPEYMNQLKSELNMVRQRYQQLLNSSSEGLKKEFHALPEEYHTISDTVFDSRAQPFLQETYESKPGFTIGDIVEMPDGKTYKKIKDGNDRDKANWELVNG
jgi:hypothetical protein